jgi:hypothetical protein
MEYDSSETGTDSFKCGHVKKTMTEHKNRVRDKDEKVIFVKENMSGEYVMVQRMEMELYPLQKMGHHEYAAIEQTQIGQEDVLADSHCRNSTIYSDHNTSDLKPRA